MDKRPIDRIRESGGYFEVGTEAEGAIVEMMTIDDQVIILKEGAVYEVIMADDIDPDRTNISLPNGMNRLLINQGINSEIVSRVLLTFKNLFKYEFYDDNAKVTKVFRLVIGIVQELIVLENEILDYVQFESRVSEDYELSRGKRGVSFIPAMVNLETKCKTIFQKANHVEQFLMEIATIFYPNKGLSKQAHFSTFHAIIALEYGSEDYFVKFVSGILGFIKLSRELRNQLDHRLSNISVKDFDIQPDGSIISPTIELFYKDIKLPRLSLSHLLPIVLKNFVMITEMVLVHIASKKAKNHIMAYEIREMPEEKRRYKFVKYCFWSPLGDGGYYNQ